MFISVLGTQPALIFRTFHVDWRGIAFNSIELNWRRCGHWCMCVCGFSICFTNFQRRTKQVRYFAQNFKNSHVFSSQVSSTNQNNWKNKHQLTWIKFQQWQPVAIKGKEQNRKNELNQKNYQKNWRKHAKTKGKMSKMSFDKENALNKSPPTKTTLLSRTALSLINNETLRARMNAITSQ